ncbi:MAG: hypothetical protein Q9166_003276 [cf. Caloplaca sp. 2 TL-2023]
MPATFIKRAVSPLLYEALRPDPDDVLYPGSDAEETLTEHEAKRRRIQQAGEQYLRGKILYIASARLRGPFTTGWMNPYTTAGRMTRVNSVKSGHRSEIAGRQSSQTTSSRGPVPTEINRTEAPKFTPTAHSRYSKPAEVILDNVDRDWLKSAPLTKGICKTTKSPTPSPAPRLRKQTSERNIVKDPDRVDAQGRTVSRSNSEGRRSRKVSTTRGIDHPSRSSLQGLIGFKEPRSGDQPAVEEARLNSLSPDTRRGHETISHADESSESHQIRRSTPKRSARTLPLSTTEFEYCYGPPERKSFKEDLEAAKKKAKARAEHKWRLSFTASGGVKSRSQQSAASVLPQPIKKFPMESRKESTSSEMTALPEAQIVPPLKVPSGPSTEMLETDKLRLPDVEDEDPYLQLSTQAAMSKAQQYFHNDLVSPASNRTDLDFRVYQATDGNDHEWECIERPVSTAKHTTPVGKDREHMSTQAMIDAISPFADTTVKKRHSVERRPERRRNSSPSISDVSSLSEAAPNFETTSLSMSTSPSPAPVAANIDQPLPLSGVSKPASSITSFSIAPNGTMTEVFQEDGQQQHQDHLMGDLDLDAAVEEAGSFLGEWNLEKEARTLERSTVGSKASTTKGSYQL